MAQSGRSSLSSPILWGIVVSVAYGVLIIVLTWILVENWRAGLSLNELGDFLSGAFAPLAFVWLVVAIFLQKSELSAQREELVLARETLGQQIEEQRRLVSQSEHQLRILEESERFASHSKHLLQFEDELAAILADVVHHADVSVSVRLGETITRLRAFSLPNSWSVTAIGENKLALLKDMEVGANQARARLQAASMLHQRDSHHAPARLLEVCRPVEVALGRLCQRYENLLSDEPVFEAASKAYQALQLSTQRVAELIEAGEAGTSSSGIPAP